MAKTLLILGNGFDLFHHLPTSYSDFLEFASRYLRIFSYNKDAKLDDYKNSNIVEWDGDERIKNSLVKLFESRKVDVWTNSDNTIDCSCTLENKELDDIFILLKANIWYEYLFGLYRIKKIQGVGWIDFEMEISRVIQMIDGGYSSLYADYHEIWGKNNSGVDDKKTKFQNACKKILKQKGNSYYTVEDLINALYSDLEDLSRAIDLYLKIFVDNLPVKKNRMIEAIRPDYIISFNYTHTYHRLYDDSVPVCHIHGECDKHDTVLGINEYLNGDEREERTDFSIFKKFVMRIRKKNDTQYRKWAEELKKIYEQSISRNKNAKINQYFSEGVSDVHVFGHSLDETDKDVLQLFLKPPFSRVRVFCKDWISEGKLISNLIKITTEECLIEKATCSPAKLDMILIENMNSLE